MRSFIICALVKAYNSRRMRWAGHVTCIEVCEVKRSLAKHRRRWDVTTKINIRIMECKVVE
jgi:hypothetical protein